MNRRGWHTLARRLAHWVTALMLLSALAPALSRALAVEAGGPPHPASPGSTWVEVCGPGGIRWVAVAAADAGSGGPVRHGLPHAAALDHCALCGLSLDRCLPDPTLDPLVPLAALLAVALPGVPTPPPRRAAGPRPARGPPV